MTNTLEFLDKIEAIEHREDGIPPMPESIGNIPEMDDALDGFITYLNRKKSGEDVILVVGFDFGTSATKIVVQHAYSDGTPVFPSRGTSVALPVPKPFQLDDHPHCWKTLLYFDEKENFFSLINDKNRREIRNIKTSIMGKSRTNDAENEAEQHHVAAYIGLLLRHVKGWLYQNSQECFGIDLKEFDIKWQINMGLPASSLENGGISAKFHNILNAAWLISETGDPLSADALRSFFDEAISDQSKFEGQTYIRPEVTAEAVCLIDADILDYKIHVLIDIGSSTLDICIFNYFEMGVPSDKKQALLVADVQLLGVQSLNWIKGIIQDDGSPFEQNDLKQAIQSTIANTIITARDKKDPRNIVWRGEDTLEILLAGGGAYSDFHRTALEDWLEKFKRQTQTTDIAIRNPAVPESLSHQSDAENAHRLAVAWGLSIFSEDFLEFDPPSKADDISRERKSTEPEYISKDQV